MVLLLQCARPHPDDAAIRRAACAVGDWDALTEKADYHGMSALLCWNLMRACPDLVPPPALDRLRQAFNANAARNLRFASELVRIASLFERAGIEFVPIKGPAVAWSLYESPALRQMGDLDLLVRPADASHAVDVLVASGAVPAYGTDLRFFRSARELPLTSSAGVGLDLHWALAAAQFGHALDLHHFWSRLVPATFAGRTFRTFAPNDLLIFLSVHGAKHFWSSLRWLADLARLIDGASLDWDAIMAYAGARRASRIVSASLLLAADVLGANVPAAVLDRARACPHASTIAVQSQLWLHGRPVPLGPSGLELRFQWSLLERPSDKLRLWWGQIAPCPADLDSLSLPRCLFPVYYAFRPLRLLAKYSAQAACRLLP